MAANEFLFYDPFEMLAPPAPLQNTLGDAVVDEIRVRLASDGVDIDSDTGGPLGDGVIDWHLAIGTLVQSHIARTDAHGVSAETS